GDGLAGRDLDRGGRGVVVDRSRAVRLPSLNEAAVLGGQVAVGVDGEAAVAGVTDLAAGVGDQVAGALDGDVGRLSGRLERTFGEVGGVGTDAHARADGDRVDAGTTRGRRRGATGDLLGEEVLELDLLVLVAHGVGVGDVVRDGVEVGLVGVDSGDGGEDGAFGHGFVPF